MQRWGILNSIIRANSPEQILVASGKDPIIAYSNIQGTWPGFGNIDEDAHFGYRGYWANSEDAALPIVEPFHSAAIWVEGDYHLASRVGRWDPIGWAWIHDDRSSICIDAGDPNSLWEIEPSPNGERINQGAYGGTSQASKTSTNCTLTVESKAGGVVVSPTVSPFVQPCGTNVPVEALADSCYVFTGWSGTAVTEGKVKDPNNLSTAVLLDADYTLIANFEPIVNTLIISPTEGGTVPNLGSGTFVLDCGTAVTGCAEPAPCYRFSHWSGTAVDMGKIPDPFSPCIAVLMDSDYTLVPHFEQITYTLMVSSTGGGVATVPGQGVLSVGCGEKVPLEAMPDYCFEFTHWSGTAVDRGYVNDVNSPLTTVTVKSDCSLAANFKRIEDYFTIDYSSSIGGRITAPVERKGSHTHFCEWVPIGVNADEPCWQFDEWTGSAVNAGKVKDPNKAETEVLYDGNYTLQANFKFIKDSLKETATGGGSVKRIRERRIYECQSEITVQAIPEQGYRFTHWSGSAVDKGKLNPEDSAITTVFVDGEYTLTAHFEPVP